jgi:REP element-mobilizing transposase RayT
VARPPRSQPPGHSFHLTARGVRRSIVFNDDCDYELYLDLLGQTARRFAWIVIGYCLMPNHVHLVIRLEKPSLSAGMHRLQGVYARKFNERHGHSGHVFEARFHSLRMEREEHLLQAIRYLARNPVDAGLCEDPIDWRWGSHAVVVGRSRRWSPVSVHSMKELFGRDGEWLSRYLAFTAPPGEVT